MNAEAVQQAVLNPGAFEESFCDVTEGWVAGKPQVRNVWSNIGCRNLRTGVYAPVDLEYRDRLSGASG